MNARWKPNVTVAAIIEQDGRYLLVEERAADGLKLNNPAGHLEPGESLVAACAREVLEETLHLFTPTALLGIYLSSPQPGPEPGDGSAVPTYLRFAFCGQLGPLQAGRQLDAGIVRTLWLTPEEIRASAARHRSPMLLHCLEDHLAGRRYPLDLLHTEAPPPDAGTRPWLG